MPPLPAKGKKDEKKKKAPPSVLCGCGAETYRPPPKGKKQMAPIEHNPGCVFQRTTCEGYPHLPRCEVCQAPCKFCAGKNRWCPHCYEHQCHYIHTRIVQGWADTAAAVAPLKANSKIERFPYIGGYFY